MLRAMCRLLQRSEGASGSNDVFFRDVEERDIASLMELQRGLFPVQYTESFYTKLFTPGYYCIVGLAPDGEVVAVASARVVAFESPTEMQSVREAYIMTLGVKARVYPPSLDLACHVARSLALRPSCAA